MENISPQYIRWHCNRH